MQCWKRGGAHAAIPNKCHGTNGCDAKCFCGNCDQDDHATQYHDLYVKIKGAMAGRKAANAKAMSAQTITLYSTNTHVASANNPALYCLAATTTTPVSDGSPLKGKITTPPGTNPLIVEGPDLKAISAVVDSDIVDLAEMKTPLDPDPDLAAMTTIPMIPTIPTAYCPEFDEWRELTSDRVTISSYECISYDIITPQIFELTRESVGVVQPSPMLLSTMMMTPQPEMQATLGSAAVWKHEMLAQKKRKKVHFDLTQNTVVPIDLAKGNMHIKYKKFKWTTKGGIASEAQAKFYKNRRKARNAKEKLQAKVFTMMKEGQDLDQCVAAIQDSEQHFKNYNDRIRIASENVTVSPKMPNKLTQMPGTPTSDTLGLWPT